MSDEEDKGKKCFVVMPYVVRERDLPKYANDPKHWTEVFDGLIAPAIVDAGLRPHREDHDNKSKIITNAIWKNIEAADIVLCDISSENPNVLVELGWTLRADKRFVLIKDDLSDISFDLRGIDIIHYSHRLQPSRLKEDRARVSDRLRSTMNDENHSYSIMKTVAIRNAVEKVVSSPTPVTVDLIKEVVAEVQKERAAEDAAKAKLADHARVIIFWRTHDFQRADANKLEEALRARGFKSISGAHVLPGPPDAIFIAEDADPAIVGVAVRHLSYMPEFIFPVDYPDNECGANSGADVSVGLSSQHRLASMIDQERPYPLSMEDWRALFDPRLTRKTLKAVLARAAPPRGS